MTTSFSIKNTAFASLDMQGADTAPISPIDFLTRAAARVKKSIGDIGAVSAPCISSDAKAVFLIEKDVVMAPFLAPGLCIYFCRFSRYQRPIPKRLDLDFAGTG